MKRLLPIAAGFAGMLSATSAAALVTLNFGGKVTTVTSGLAGGFSANQVVSGQIVYDETRAVTAASGYYYAYNDFTGYVTIGGKTYTFVPTMVTAVANNSSGADWVQFYSGASTGAMVNGLSSNYLNLSFYDYSQTALPAAIIPSGTQIQNFGTRYLSLYFGPNYGQSVSASITAINVPEPASWAMMIMGFGMTGLIARRSVGRRGLASHG